MGKVIKAFFAFLVVAAFIFVGVLYIAGGSAAIDEGIPSIGVDPVNVPLAGEGQTIPVQWVVRGAQGQVKTGVYVSRLSSSVRYDVTVQGSQPVFIEGTQIQLDGKTAYQVDVPNSFDPNYVRFYAQIDGGEYWSKEYKIDKQ